MVPSNCCYIVVMETVSLSMSKMRTIDEEYLCVWTHKLRLLTFYVVSAIGPISAIGWMLCVARCTAPITGIERW